MESSTDQPKQRVCSSPTSPDWEVAAAAAAVDAVALAGVGRLLAVRACSEAEEEAGADNAAFLDGAAALDC